MADCIDQNNLPGVQVVCRDFAVLEDHSLAHSLQEQEIENHLASNVCRSRRTQQDLRIAKQLQEEEDRRARARLQQLLRDTERTDGEMAVGMQEQLVRQAQQLQWQEEKDKAMARRLQEREVMAERKRRNEEGAAFEEGLFQEEGVRNPKSGPLSIRHGSSWKQRAPPDTGSALHKKEKPARPPPPQWDRPSIKAQHQGDRDGDLTEPVDRGSQTMQAVSDVVPGPQRASAAWEEVTAVVSGWDQPPLLGCQRSSPGLAGGGKTWNTQEELLVSLSSNDSLEDTCPSSGGTGRNMQLHGFMDMTQGMEHLTLREQELQDFEVAKRFQMEEMMASSFIKSASQVAQDKEMAWKIMEEEEKNYKKCRDWEEEEKLTPDEVMRQRPVEDCNYQRPQSQTPQRPARLPLPLHSYKSAESSFLYSRGSASPGSSPQLPARPAAPARGSHYRQ